MLRLSPMIPRSSLHSLQKQVKRLLALSAFLSPCSAATPSDGEAESPYVREILRDNPIGYFRFEEAETDNGAVMRNFSSAVKRVGDGVCGKNVQQEAGPTGIGGRAASFAGSGFVEIPHDPLFDSAELTVEFWMRSDQVFDKPYWPGSATLISKATPGPGSGDWCILGGSTTDGKSGQLLVGIGPQGGGDAVMNSATITNDGLFHHVVWTRDSSGHSQLHVDGKLAASIKDSSGKITNARPIHIGGENLEKGGSFFRGGIDEVAIYGSVLPVERIKAHFASGVIDPQLPKPADRVVDFVKDIKPIFQEACYKCHGRGKDKGGLSLATHARAMEGGDDGPALQPGNSAISELVRRIASKDDDLVMPPEDDPLSAEQIGLIRAWIDQGAVWPESADEKDPSIAKAAEHWSFKPLKQPQVPNTQNSGWIRTPVDAFILDRLNQSGLAPSPPAEKEKLLRRISFDLTGLAPTPEEIESFVRDTAPDAYARVVERLLASPTYGERWARHWLDVVRYADSGGYETDIIYEQAWRYRDYVIHSIQDDKPYDRFLMEQVAGDELWPEQAEEMQKAVAVWTLGEWQNALDAFPDMLEYVRRTDNVVTLSEAALGLTVGCANCHNHKYDPISQRDYFGLEAIFAASESFNKNTNETAWKKGETTAYRMLRHRETPTPIHLLKRGELTKPTRRIEPALPAFLPGGGPLPTAAEENTRRRAELARWLVAKQNPLTARVIANRVWQWHFGQALAATPNDLGTQGARPTHPELLDWLASQLIHDEWSLKKLHRLIVLSSTYQQSNSRDAKAIDADPLNALLAGFPQRRLEAEEVWDQLHRSAGTLDLKSYGTPFVPELSAEELQPVYNLGKDKDSKWPVTAEQNRRAIYILNRRSFRFPLFEAFDPANTAVSCPQRQTTTVPAQALTLMNNNTVARQSRAMAARLLREAGGDVAKEIRLAWLLAYSREPDTDEMAIARKFIGESETLHANADAGTAHAAALEDFCLGIMNSSEYIYVN